MPIIRSISGLRATISDGCLSRELIKNYISAYTNCLSNGPIVIGRDGRPSGKWIEEDIIELLINLGWDVKRLGIVPTPTVQIITEKTDAAGGIVITASHNPSDWNGLKFINSSGIFFDAKENSILWKYLDSNSQPRRLSINKGQAIEVNDAINFHIEKIFELPFWNKITKYPLNASVDAVNSAGSKAIPALLEGLDCTVNRLYCNGSGNFPHLPEPLPENLADLCVAVRESHSQIGLAVDPDADRLVLIDENGNAIGEENTIVLAVWSVLELSDNPSEVSIVVNHSTTQSVDEIANKYGAKVYRSPVGEINVVKKMQEIGAIIGGEGSGGVIYAPLHYGRDSLIGTSLVLALMWKLNKTLGELKEMLPKNVIVKTKMQFEGDFAQLSENIRNEFPTNEMNIEDGIKIFYPQSWVQIRKSNTEPIIRVISEAKNEELAQELINKIKKIIK
ncbi:MAG: phosphoglucosamine mutase [Chloroherpetonaceae bacterium]